MVDRLALSQAKAFGVLMPCPGDSLENPFSGIRQYFFFSSSITKLINKVSMIIFIDRKAREIIRLVAPVRPFACLRSNF